jgi:hypothetical protein
MNKKEILSQSIRIQKIRNIKQCFKLNLKLKIFSLIPQQVIFYFLIKFKLKNLKYYFINKII